MEKKLKTDQVISLLGHVIKTIDQWWTEITDLKSGYFTRSYIGNSSVTYKNYVEWRYSELSKDFVQDYASIFISLECEDGTDYIQIALKKLKDGVYTEYDPFCEIHDGKTEVVISEQTGFGLDNITHHVLTGRDFDVLTNAIADTVHKFMVPPNEEKVGVNMDEASKTLSVHDIQDCMIKAVRIMLIDRDTVNELTRLGSKHIIDDHDLSPTRVKNMLGYTIDVTPKRVVTRIVYGDITTLCGFTCEPDTHDQHEFIIRYNSRDTGFKCEQGINILYKNPDMYCFEYTADGLNTEKVFKPFVNIIRNTLNHELYQSLPQFQDNEITAPAGLTTKEVFVLDTSYFVIGDIYLLEIDPVYGSKLTYPPVKVPRWVYAICEDVCSTVINFMLGGIDGRDQLFRIPVHADEIESGLVTVKRVLMNDTLIQDVDE